jgi:hypothetical protein
MAMPVVTLFLLAAKLSPGIHVPPLPQVTLAAGDYTAHVTVAKDRALTITITGRILKPRKVNSYDPEGA